jgi:hypothetical protein
VHEAEESPLLEAVAREWLVKIQQVGKRLSRCCGGSVLTCSSELCV